MSILPEGQAARVDEPQRVIELWRRSPHPYLLQIMHFFITLLADGGGKTLTKEMGLKLCAVVNILSSQGSKHLSHKPKIKQVGPKFQDAGHHHPQLKSGTRIGSQEDLDRACPHSQHPSFCILFCKIN